ncbi:uncharacterized protein LOC125156232 [Prionailurus viverrinus]|uniref:uncharacterized protein LOC125156232 n=1 Tax=Prionailurus viverrinus TaxID=61388 RepID=UPI001FF405C1|nr:uncharacterized protein LOC125156232 [Prionailurus viverrinus]
MSRAAAHVGAGSWGNRTAADAARPDRKLSARVPGSRACAAPRRQSGCARDSDPRWLGGGRAASRLCSEALRPEPRNPELALRSAPWRSRRRGWKRGWGCGGSGPAGPGAALPDAGWGHRGGSRPQEEATCPHQARVGETRCPGGPGEPRGVEAVREDMCPVRLSARAAAARAVRGSGKLPGEMTGRVPAASRGGLALPAQHSCPRGRLWSHDQAQLTEMSPRLAGTRPGYRCTDLGLRNGIIRNKTKSSTDGISSDELILE